MLAARKTAIKELVRQQKIEMKTFSNLGYYPELETLVLSLPKHKLSGPSQRSQFVKFLYDYIIEYGKEYNIPVKEIDGNLVIKLAVLAELIIDCQYYENYIFDGKNGVTDSVQIRKYLNAAMLLKSEIFKYIREGFSDDPDTAEKVRACTDNIFNLVNIGQQIEANWNHYDTFLDEERLKELPNFGYFVDKNINNDIIKEIKKIILKGIDSSLHERNFMHLYLVRLNLISVALFSKFGDLLLDLTSFPDNNTAQRIRRFSTLFGTCVQMVNDNIDIVPEHTGSKVPEDAFSDLRNKNITLPIFYYLTLHKKGKGQLKTILNSNADGLIFEPKTVHEHGRCAKVLSPHLQETVNAELKPVIAQYAIPATQHIAELANLEIDTKLNMGQIIADLLSIASGNRFYQHFPDAPTTSFETETEKKWTFPGANFAAFFSPKKHVKTVNSIGFKTLQRI